VDFGYGDDQELLRSSTRGFLDKRGGIRAVREVLEEPAKVHHDAWRAGAELGWTAMLVPADHDGGSVTEQPLVDLAVLAEEFGRVLHPGPLIPTNVVADAITRDGSEEQRKNFLGPIARGEYLAAWCLSGDASPDPAAIELHATRVGDGFTLDGRAGYVHGATDADLLLVTATTEAAPVNLLVPLPAAGVSTRALTGLDLTRTLGEVTFAGVAVPDSAAMGSSATIARALDVATVLQAAEAVGAADHLFETTVQYLQDRIQFGRSIASFQAIKHRLADLKITVEGMRAATYYAALALADDLDDADAGVATAGAYVDDAYAFVAGEALQLHGGIGFTWEHDVHLFVRRAKVNQTLYGDSAWHRERLCAHVEGQVR
jgi:alkylation response protein AidB-like acyl-CoA dehydrogenase